MALSTCLSYPLLGTPDKIASQPSWQSTSTSVLTETAKESVQGLTSVDLVCRLLNEENRLEVSGPCRRIMGRLHHDCITTSLRISGGGSGPDNPLERRRCRREEGSVCTTSVYGPFLRNWALAQQTVKGVYTSTRVTETPCGSAT